MADPLARAARALAEGELVFYPTDTLYGLGARAEDRAAVDRLLALKGRPAGLPISVAFASYEEVEPYVALSPMGRAYVRRNLPGPVTALVDVSRTGRARLAPALLGDGRTLGIRIPDHPVARALAARAGPLTSTSANRHGLPPCTSGREARRAFGDGVAVYLTGAPAPSGSPSSLVDLTGDAPRPVRRG